MARLRRKWTYVAGWALAFAWLNSASAQTEYPVRPLKVVVPLPPGPVADLVPRIIGDKLAAKWGQSVIVENRPGAALNLGADAVAKAEPDGHTLLATPPGPLVVSQHFFPKLTFDPTAFVPVSVLVKVPAVVVVHPKVPATSLPELIAYAKNNPAKLSYGSPGTGNTPQLAMERLTRAAGIKLVHVPYQGLAPALRDLLAGHIDVMIDNLGNVADHIAAGRLRLIAVTTETRISQLPATPTVGETLPGITHSDWFAVVAPPRTPEAIADKIAGGIADVLKLPDVVQRMEQLHLVPIGSRRAETAALIKRDSEIWRRVIAEAGLKAE